VVGPREARFDANALMLVVFAREDGSYVKPEVVSTTFHALVAAAGLRRVRLHDLRHGQASIMLAAGVDMTVVSKRLGHSGIRITADTYTHLLEGVGRQAAEAAAALVPRGSSAGAGVGRLGSRSGGRDPATARGTGAPVARTPVP
jgi:site-specific recombinase XerD